MGCTIIWIFSFHLPLRPCTHTFIGNIENRLFDYSRSSAPQRSKISLPCRTQPYQIIPIRIFKYVCSVHVRLSIMTRRRAFKTGLINDAHKNNLLRFLRTILTIRFIVFPARIFFISFVEFRSDTPIGRVIIGNILPTNVLHTSSVRTTFVGRNANPMNGDRSIRSRWSEIQNV